MGPTAVNELGGPDRAGVYPQGAVPDGFRPWRFRYRGGDFDCSPVVCDGTVYVNASRGPCFALDALTGACRWRFTAPGGVCNAPAVMDGQVFVTDWNHGLWALDAVSGRVRWHREGSRYCKNVLAQGGVVYLSDVGYPFKFIRGKGDLVAVDAASGQDLCRPEERLRGQHDRSVRWPDLPQRGRGRAVRLRCPLGRTAVA